METRPLGNTGESFPILSFGAQRVVDEMGSQMGHPVGRDGGRSEIALPKGWS
jgi:hypothetical protein